MLQETHDSECHCCLIVKYLIQLRKQFTFLIRLVQFNWYGKQVRGNDEALTWGGNLINLFSPKDVYKRSLFFFLVCSRAHQCFRKEQKEK